MLKVGERAPEFEAPDQNGKTHKLSDYAGKWVLLYFYPKDDTPGCTTEACTIRDSFADFGKSDLTVLGVSGDSVESHGKFSTKYGLPFTILADPEKKLIKAYGADGLFRRISYLIAPDGTIAKDYPKVKPAEHAAEVLEDLISLKKQST